MSNEVQALITILKQASEQSPAAQSWPVAVDTWFSYCDAAEMSLLFQELLQLDVPLDEGSQTCLLYTSPSPRDRTRSRMPSSA